jgi:rubrerythrin
MEKNRKDLEALEIALQTEEEGYQLYQTASKHTQQEFTKSVFTQLAKDELLHKDLIKRFYSRLKETDSWGDLSEEDKDYKKSKQNMKTIFSGALRDAKTGKLEFTNSDINAYQKAVEFEKNGVKLYDRLSKETADQFAKKFYAFLREMEQEHYELLDNTLTYIQRPSNYYLLEEGWTLDD